MTVLHFLFSLFTFAVLAEDLEWQNGRFFIAKDNAVLVRFENGEELAFNNLRLHVPKPPKSKDGKNKKLKKRVTEDIEEDLDDTEETEEKPEIRIEVVPETWRNSVRQSKKIRASPLFLLSKTPRQGSPIPGVKAAFIETEGFGANLIVVANKDNLIGFTSGKGHFIYACSLKRRGNRWSLIPNESVFFQRQDTFDGYDFYANEIAVASSPEGNKPVILLYDNLTGRLVFYRVDLEKSKKIFNMKRSSRLPVSFKVGEPIREGGGIAYDAQADMLRITYQPTKKGDAVRTVDIPFGDRPVGMSENEDTSAKSTEEELKLETRISWITDPREVLQMLDSAKARYP